MLDALGGHAHTVRLSGDTVAKQTVRHREVRAGDYAIVQRVLDEGEWFKQSDTHAVGFLVADDGLWRAVVKATRDRSETYLVSFHRARYRDLRAARRRWLRIEQEEE